MDMLYWYEESRIDVYQNLLYFLYQGMKLCGLEAFFEMCSVQDSTGFQNYRTEAVSGTRIN